MWPPAYRELAERERDRFPAKTFPVKSPRHKQFAQASMATPRSNYATTICSSVTQKTELKDNPWYASQHHIPIGPMPARTGRIEHFKTVDEPAFPKDPKELRKQEIRVLRHQVRYALPCYAQLSK